MSSFRCAWLYITTGFCLLALSIASAQSPAISRLKTQLQLNLPDSTRAQLDFSFGETDLHYQDDSALAYFRKSITLSKKLANYRLLARAYSKLGYVYLIQSSLAQSLSALQQGEQLCPRLAADSICLEIQVLNAIAHRSQGESLQQCLNLLKNEEHVQSSA